MARNKIYAIVEGHSEAKSADSGQSPSVTNLIINLLQALDCQMLFPGNRIQRMRSGGDFFVKDKLENAIRRYKERDDCSAVLVLLDMDDDCPKEKAHELTTRIRAMEKLPFSVVVVCARREYETWFLASLETICGQKYPGDPEAKRDAKGWLIKEFRYKPTVDQKTYTQKLDVNLAKSRSRSFRRLYHAFEEIIQAIENDQPVITPGVVGRL